MYYTSEFDLISNIYQYQVEMSQINLTSFLGDKQITLSYYLALYRFYRDDLVFDFTVPPKP